MGGHLLTDEGDVLEAQFAGALGQAQLERWFVTVEREHGLFGPFVAGDAAV